MKRILAAALGLSMLGGGVAAAAPKRKPATKTVHVKEGWYRIEDGSGPSDKAPEEEAIIIAETSDEVAQAPRTQTPPPAQPTPPPSAQMPQEPMPPPAPAPQQQPAPTPEEGQLSAADAELRHYMKPDCQSIRGEYLERLMELHGMNAGALPTDPRSLEVWTHKAPVGAVPPVGLPWPVTTDPAAAPLFGTLPVPPGALAFDFTLRNLAYDLLRCENGDGRPATPPAAMTPAPGQGQGGSGAPTTSPAAPDDGEDGDDGEAPPPATHI